MMNIENIFFFYIGETEPNPSSQPGHINQQTLVQSAQ